MAAINKEAFLKRIGSKTPTPPMEGSPEEEGGESAEEASTEGDMSCGEQLMNAIDAKDPVAIDAALKEAVAKYSGG